MRNRGHVTIRDGACGRVGWGVNGRGVVHGEVWTSSSHLGALSGGAHRGILPPHEGARGGGRSLEIGARRKRRNRPLGAKLHRLQQRGGLLRCGRKGRRGVRGTLGRTASVPPMESRSVLRGPSTARTLLPLGPCELRFGDEEDAESSSLSSAGKPAATCRGIRRIRYVESGRGVRRVQRVGHVDRR